MSLILSRCGTWTLVVTLTLAIAVMAAPEAKGQSGGAAEMAIRNARIYTANPDAPVASEIGISQGRIVSVGGAGSARIGPRTLVIDAAGRTVLPGFIDSHGHVRGLGESLEILDLRTAASAEEAAASVARAAKERRSGEWIMGRGWDQTRWPGAAFPTADVLSRAAPQNPVYLTRVDGHAAWVNRRALDLGDINAATPDPPGGRIVRDSRGAPAGVLVDTAMALVRRVIPPPSKAEVKARIERGARECARLGITTVHDAGVSADDLAAYRDLIAARRLPVRIYAMIRGEGPLWNEYRARGPEIGEYLTVRSIKLVADGALGSRGAALLEPYADEPTQRGLAILSLADVERVARQAVESGLQVNTHAIGDRANRTVLEAYGAALGGKNDKRFRIEHAQVVAEEDFPLLARFSVIASMQATHATSDMRWAEQRVGPERIRGAYAWRSMLRLGVPVANGSDFPVEEANPLPGFHASVTRQDSDGRPRGGWFPSQAMTREEALRSWTYWGAYAAFEEKQKGTLEAGKFADLVMLSDDIMQAEPPAILKARVTMTVVGGRIVYQEGSHP